MCFGGVLILCVLGSRSNPGDYANLLDAVIQETTQSGKVRERFCFAAASPPSLRSRKLYISLPSFAPPQLLGVALAIMAGMCACFSNFLFASCMPMARRGSQQQAIVGNRTRGSCVALTLPI